MGYDIWQRGSSFCIRKENFPGLVKVAIQRFPDLFDEMSWYWGNSLRGSPCFEET